MSDPQHEIKEWLARKLEPHGSAKAASEGTGISADKLTRSKELDSDDPKKRRKIQPFEIEALAKHFQDLPPGYERMSHWLDTNDSATGLPTRHADPENTWYATSQPAPFLTAAPASDAVPAESVIPVMGFVGAGSEVEPDIEQVPLEGFEEVTLPFLIPEEMIAFRVRGVSMLPILKPDTIIVVYREQRLPLEAFYGEEAAVRLSDGRRFIKTIRRGSRKTLVTLESPNAEPIEDVKLDWIGEIFATLPRRQISKLVKVGGIQGQLRLPAAE